MRYREIINELFIQPVTWRMTRDKSHTKSYSFTVNEIPYSVDLMKTSLQDNTWGVGFDITSNDDNDYKITNTGNATIVFATVIDIIKSFISQHNPDSLQFVADIMEPSRVKLYRRMVQKLIPDNYSIEENTAGNYTKFTMTRIQDIKENIQFTLSPSSLHNNETIVNVNTHMIDNAWKQDPDFYIGHNGTNGIRNRYQGFHAFINTTTEQIQVSEINVDEQGHVTFTNGRHRFAYLRDHGMDVIPVAMDQTSITNAEKFNYLIL